MDLLKIGLIADTSKAIEGMEKTAKSVNTLGNALISGKKVAHEYGLALDQKLAEISEKVSAGLISNQKGIEQSYKLLAEQRAKMLAGMGEESKEYKTLVTYSDAYKQEIDKLNAAQEKQASTTKAVGVAQSSVDKTTKEVTRSFKEQTTYLQKLFSVAKNILTFQLLMSPIRNGLRGIKDTLRESVTVAAEAEQRFSKLATVFDGMSDSAKAMAQSLAGSLGVANSTAASALSTVGDLLQAQGMGTAESLSTSAGWIQQFQDIIAFKDINMSLEEFAQNFMSGAAGNLRNFRTFGSIVKESAVNARLAAEGYDKLTGSQLELAKMTARAEIALEQQKNAIGATEREWDTMLSVNRRLNEAWKEYKENLGDTINSTLKPLKSWWTQVLEQINKANKAKKEFEAGNESIGVYDVANNSADADSFVAAVSPLISNFYSVEKNLDKYSDLVTENIVKPLDDELVKFSASLETLNKLFDNKLPKALLDLLAPYENARNARTKAKKDSDARGKTYLSALESFDSFQEVLLGIKGVSFTPYDFSANAPRNYDSYQAYASSSQDRLQSVLNIMGTKTVENITDAFTSLKNSPLEKWGDIIMSQLEDFDMEGLFKAKIETVAELFTAVWNEAWRDGIFDDEEKQRLEDIKDYYREINKDLEKYVAGQALISSYNSGLSSLSSSSASYGRQIELIGLSEFDTQVKELTFAFEDMKAQFSGFTSDELKELGIDLTKLDEEFGKQITAYTDLYNAQQAYAAALAAQSAVSGLVTGAQGRLAKTAFVNEHIGTTLRFANGEGYAMNAAQAGALYDYRQTRSQMLDNLAKLTPNAAGQYDLGGGLLMTLKEIDAVMQDDLLQNIKDLADAVEKTASEFWKQYNPFQSTVDAFNTGKEELGGVSGGIWGILLELVKNTEAFQTLMSLVQDTIVPIMDAVLKPLMPALESITTLFDMLPWEIITFGIKVISSTLVLILHPIKMIFAIVHNIFEWLKHPVNKGARDIISLNAIADETNALLDKIWKTTTDIERNTDKDNLALLRDLYSRGIINEDQFYAGARVVQKDMVFDPAQATNPSYIASNSPASRAISYGGFTFYITGNDPEETARATIRALREAGVDLPYNTAIGRA